LPLTLAKQWAADVFAARKGLKGLKRLRDKMSGFGPEAKTQLRALGAVRAIMPDLCHYWHEIVVERSPEPIWPTSRGADAMFVVLALIFRTQSFKQARFLI
jgi:hypothetical protein